MPTKLKGMSGKEFAKKVIAGERDFSKIKILPLNGTGLHYPAGNFKYDFNNDGYDLMEHLRGLQEKLKTDPIVLDGSDLSNIIANGLEMPYVGARGTCFKNSRLLNSNFSYGVFTGADFTSADLENVNFHSAEFHEANFEYANLKYAKNLRYAEGLATAIYGDTRVTPDCEKIILDELSKRFLVEK